MALLDRFRKADTTPETLSTEIGATGLKHVGGIVTEEFLRDLQGTKGMNVFRQMGDNDAIIGTGLLLIRMWLRAAEWTVVPYSEQDESPTDEAETEAEVLRGMMDDMSHTWSSFTDELFTHTPQFGWSWFETVYKKRNGEQPTPGDSSKFDDGRWGWRKFALRPAESYKRFVFDEAGGVSALVQNGTGSKEKVIPISKSLLFRTTTLKGNPLGRSFLRNAYRAWWLRMRMEEAEAIGVERDLVGMPVIYVPEDVLTKAEYATAKRAYEKVASDLKSDEQAGVVLPAIFDSNGNRLVSLELLASPGGRTFDTTAIVGRQSREMLMSMLADVALMGHENVGTQALASEKVDLFTMGMTAILSDAADIINRHEIPRVRRLNREPLQTAPRINVVAHTDFDVAETLEGLLKLSQSGAPIWADNPDLAGWVTERTGIPIPTDLGSLDMVFDTPPQ